MTTQPAGPPLTATTPTPPPGFSFDPKDPRLQAAVATAVISGALFLIRLLTHADVPSWIAGLLAAVIPAAVAYIGAHLAWGKTPPGNITIPTQEPVK